METASKPRKERTPSVRLDDQAKQYVTAVETLTGLPFYEGPTVQQVIDTASAAASKAVHDLYATLIGKAKLR